MIKLEFNNNHLALHSQDILNATALTALPEGFPIVADDINWSLDTTIDKHIPVINGTYTDDQDRKTFLKPRIAVDLTNNTVQLTGMSIDSEALVQPVNFTVTPLVEFEILAKLSQENERRPQSQLKTYCSSLKPMYADNQDYNIEKPVPKLFFSKFDFDYYMSNLSVSLAETILLWMETTKRFSVSLDDPDINIQSILTKSIKRVHMYGVDRSHVMAELHNGDKLMFDQLTPAVQVEITNMLLSIIQEV